MALAWTRLRLCRRSDPARRDERNSLAPARARPACFLYCGRTWPQSPAVGRCSTYIRSIERRSPRRPVGLPNRPAACDLAGHAVRGTVECRVFPSSQRRGGFATKSCEATEAPQTGAKREREAVIVVSSAKSSGLNSFAELTTPAAPFRNASIFLYGASTPPLRGGECDSAERWVTVIYQRPLELIPQREKDTPVATVGSPLIEEVCGIDPAFRDAEVSRVGRVVHFRTELKIMALSDAGIFYEAHVDLAQAIGTQGVSADITDAYSRRECAEKRTPSSVQQFRNGHSGRIERRVQVRTNSIADQPRDSV